jgi:hypothetical protein
MPRILRRHDLWPLLGVLISTTLCDASCFSVVRPFRKHIYKSGNNVVKLIMKEWIEREREREGEGKRGEGGERGRHAIG